MFGRIYLKFGLATEYLNIGMGLFDIISHASGIDHNCSVKSGKRTILELINNVAFA